MSYRAFSVTVTGGSHKKRGKGCEDFSYSGDIESKGFLKTSWLASVAVVADGHGDSNCFRAAKGAEFAAQCAKTGIEDFIKTYNRKTLDTAEFEESLRRLVKHIVARWQIAVEEDYVKNPFTEAELAGADKEHRAEYESKKAGKRGCHAYGTTLIAAAVTADYWFGIHIGDGRLTALYADGTYDQPVPWDEKCFLNVTTSVSDDDAAERARVYFSFHKDKAPPAAVFLCSDGVDDSYPVDGNERHLFKLYRAAALAFADDGFDSTRAQLKDLAVRFATVGKGDDTSIAGFIDMDAVKETAAVWRGQIADEEGAAARTENSGIEAYGEFCTSAMNMKE
ncbi:MAG: PP2C family serine/threonine-protein phosphatase [Treponemataceae bacterium]|nr:MAG: PP2C family serine/threonine-protein phosphatase [Treponemataceae bacterium]